MRSLLTDGLLFALIMRPSIFGIAILSLAQSAMACQWKQRPTEEIVAGAKSIFRARVTEVKLLEPRPPALDRYPKVFEAVEARYDVLETFKGEPPSAGIVRDFMFAPGNCSLGLFPGWEYIFIPDSDGMVPLPTGSFGYFNREAKAVKPRIDEIRDLTRTKQ